MEALKLLALSQGSLIEMLRTSRVVITEIDRRNVLSACEGVQELIEDIIKGAEE